MAYSLKPLGLPSLTDGTMRAPRDTAVGLASTFSTTARSTSKVLSSTLRTPASTAARSSSRAARGSVAVGLGGGAAATGEAGRGTSPPSSEMRSSRCDVEFSKSTYLPRMRVTGPASGISLPIQ